MKTSSLRNLAALVIAVAATSTFASTAQTRYTVTDLGDLPGSYDISFGADINEQGWVTGISYNDIGRRAFLWKPQTGMQDLGSLGGGGFESIGSRINNQGQIIGWSFVDQLNPPSAYVWSLSGGMQDLGKIGVGAVNNQGTIAGSQLLVPGQPPRSLPTGFTALAINDREQMAGIKKVGSATHVFLLDGNQLSDLGALPATNQWAYANDMNNQADVVGVSYLNGGREHAVLWRNGNLIDLGDFAGGIDSSRAMGINNLGQIVGYGTRGGVSLGEQRASMWGSDGSMVDLNDLISPATGWTLVEADAINSSGQIVGWGVNPTGNTRAFLLSPVPEPHTYVLLLLGCLTMMFMVRRPTNQ